MNIQASFLPYITQSLKGAWELIKLNPRGMDYFDKTADGFWKSFWVLALGTPILFLWGYLTYDIAVEKEKTGIIWANIAAYYLMLPLFALLMIFYTKFININKYYSQMVIAYNWLSLLNLYIVMVLELVMWTGIVSEQAGLTITIAMRLYFNLFVIWFMFKHSLKISGILAVGVVVFELLTSLSVLSLLIRFLDLNP